LNPTKNNKAAVLYSLIGNHIPDSVLTKLSKEELEALSSKIESMKKSSTQEEKNVLSDFAKGLSFARPSQAIQNQINSLILEGMKNKDLVEELKLMTKSELELIVKDEDAKVIAIIMCFSNPDEASKLIENYPDRIREEIIDEIHKIDFHSETIKDDLERFLKFKSEIIESNTSLSKVKSRGSKKAAEILSRISPNVSSKLFSGLRKINPLFAEKINEHFYTIQDLQFATRTSLSDFFKKLHPIIIASSLKGIETLIKDKLLERAEPWLAKQISLEMDSMGPISLAEIEESQKAVVTLLNESVENGTIKLWKV
jgi:flagellar motor switch protein FliG